MNLCPHASCSLCACEHPRNMVHDPVEQALQIDIAHLQMCTNCLYGPVPLQLYTHSPIPDARPSNPTSLVSQHRLNIKVSTRIIYIDYKLGMLA